MFSWFVIGASNALRGGAGSRLRSLVQADDPALLVERSVRAVVRLGRAQTAPGLKLLGFYLILELTTKTIISCPAGGMTVAVRQDLQNPAL